MRTCEYERVLYDSVRRITQADVRDGHVRKRHVWSRGYGAPGRCHVCGRRPDLQDGHMLAFRWVGRGRAAEETADGTYRLTVWL